MRVGLSTHGVGRVAVGEESGQMAVMLRRLTVVYQEDAQTALMTFTALLAGRAGG